MTKEQVATELIAHVAKSLIEKPLEGAS
jgi:hypothetical protein